MTNLQKIEALALGGQVDSIQLRQYADCLLAIQGDTPSAWACSCDCGCHRSVPGGWCPGTAFCFVPYGHEVDPEVDAFIAAFAAKRG